MDTNTSYKDLCNTDIKLIDFSLCSNTDILITLSFRNKDKIFVNRVYLKDLSPLEHIITKLDAREQKLINMLNSYTLD